MSWNSEAWRSDPVVVVAGREHTVQPGDVFVATIKRLARENGIHNFNVVVDGNTISPEDAPETFDGVSKVEIVRYDKVG